MTRRGFVKAWAALAALAILGAGGCSRLSYRPRPGAEVGIASWYGPDFHGRPTSNREIFDMNDMTAAHKTLPFGTRVMVTNLDNDLTAVVRINDRGPFVRGRIIDVSYAAARVLGMIGPGTARVRLEVLGAYREPERDSRCFVQVGSFTIQENAHALKRRLEADYHGVLVETYKTPDAVYYRVRVKAGDRLEALRIAGRLAGQGYPVIIVTE
jgi:rare lipoprotein A